MKKINTVLMIMMDAFRHDYITEEDSPFIHALAQNGASGSLIPSFGFEPDGAYFSGLNPEECDGGAQYWRNPDEKVFYFQNLFRLLDILPTEYWHKFLRKVIRFTAQRMADAPMTKRMAPPNQIPLHMLNQFSFPMQHFPYESGFTQSPTIFDVARHNKLNYFFHGHPEYKVKTPSVVERYLRKDHGQYDFAFLFMGDLDGVGHKFGPNSPERRTMLRKMDSAIASIYKHAENNYKNTDILIFGDHGMVEVDEVLDLTDITKFADNDPDVASYFIDSTFARFWLTPGKTGTGLRRLLDSMEYGHILTTEEIRDYRIRYPHNFFGDLVFCVDDKKLIHPSFYTREDQHPLGMHGYLPGSRDNESAFIINTKRCTGIGDIGRIDMRRVYPTVLDLLGVLDGATIPHELKSVLQ